MDCKLTLKLDKDIIEEAKHYATQRGLSLSRMVERYFRCLVQKEEKEVRLSGLVAEMAGRFAGIEVEEGKEGYTEYLLKKYS